MAENSKIEWCHHTFNPWIGCTKVGPGCDHCYAEADFDKRRHVVQWGAGQPRKRTAPSTWAMPLKWNAEAERLGIRYRVFCASLADVFDNEVPAEWRADLFHLIEETPNLDWLLVTKRIGNAEKMMWKARLSLVGSTRLVIPKVLPNVWIGATITNQAEADRDIPKLLEVPAAVRFLSMEPLLGPVDLYSAYLPCPNAELIVMDPETGAHECCSDCDYTGTSSEMGIDWVIVGGESGPKARPMHPQWARDLRDQCAEAGVPFLFKQHGEWLATDFCDDDTAMIPSKSVVYVRLDGSFHDGSEGVDFFGGDQETAWVGKKAAGRLLDGVLHDGYPEVKP